MPRRTGKEDSASRVALMDAVEAVMREDGYAALSARTIARRAGLNYQLVFYYFSTLEGLLLATYRRRTDRLLEYLEAALDQPRPLHALWESSSDPFEAALSLEYMAMSNHNAAIRAESIQHVERSLALTAAKMARHAMGSEPGSETMSTTAVSMLVAMIGSNLGFQAAQGITGGGLPEVRALVTYWLDRLEPAGGG